MSYQITNREIALNSKFTSSFSEWNISMQSNIAHYGVSGYMNARYKMIGKAEDGDMYCMNILINCMCLIRNSIRFVQPEDSQV